MKKFWKAVGTALLYFAVFMGIQFLVTMAGTLILLGNLVFTQGSGVFQNVDHFHGALMDLLMENMTFLVLASNLITIGVFYLIQKLRHRKFCREIGLQKTTGRNLVMSMIFATGVCFFMDLLTAVLPVSEQTMENFETQHGMLWFGDAGITFLSVALIGPVSEEICFRGLIYGSLKKSMKPWLAGILSAVLFGLAHGDLVWFLVSFSAGLFLCWVFETTGSLLCAMVVHVTNNALSSMTAYVPMPESLHRILVMGSIGVILIAGGLLYRWNHQEIQKDEI